MHIIALGLRGMPQVEGGVEKHAEELYPRLASLGCRVEVIVRSPYHAPAKERFWKGVKLIRLWSPRRAGLEALVHTCLGTVYAALRRPDVLHIHAIGPALLTPVARLLGLKVVVTHHGADYEREKWGPFARLLLRAGEMFGMRFANDRIVISGVIQNSIAQKYGKSTNRIPNGITLPGAPVGDAAPLAWGAMPRKYVLQVGRFVPEKRQMDLVRAFRAAELPGWKLVFVGSLDPDKACADQIRAAVDGDSNVILTGFQSGRALEELYGNAGMFVLPSSHEGLPIALLEALSHGLQVIASDIPANLEVGLPGDHYFPLGSVEELTKRLVHFSTRGDEDAHQVQDWVSGRHDWTKIALQTMCVFRGLKT